MYKNINVERSTLDFKLLDLAFRDIFIAIFEEGMRKGINM